MKTEAIFELSLSGWFSAACCCWGVLFSFLCLARDEPQGLVLTLSRFSCWMSPHPECLFFTWFDQFLCLVLNQSYSMLVVRWVCTVVCAVTATRESIARPSLLADCWVRSSLTPFASDFLGAVVRTGLMFELEEGQFLPLGWRAATAGFLPFHRSVQLLRSTWVYLSFAFPNGPRSLLGDCPSALPSTAVEEVSGAHLCM